MQWQHTGLMTAADDPSAIMPSAHQHGSSALDASQCYASNTPAPMLDCTQRHQHSGIHLHTLHPPPCTPPACPTHVALPMLQARVANFISKQAQGLRMLDQLRAHTAFRNPTFLQQCVQNYQIQQYSSALPSEVFDPAGLPAEDFYDELCKQVSCCSRARCKLRLCTACAAAAAAAAGSSACQPSCPPVPACCKCVALYCRCCAAWLLSSACSTACHNTASTLPEPTASVCTALGACLSARSRLTAHALRPADGAAAAAAGRAKGETSGAVCCGGSAAGGFSSRQAPWAQRTPAGGSTASGAASPGSGGPAGRGAGQGWGQVQVGLRRSLKAVLDGFASAGLNFLLTAYKGLSGCIMYIIFCRLVHAVCRKRKL